MAGKMTVDELLQNMPKMMRIADDMHDMVSYINDLRIVTIVCVAAGALGGIGYVLLKMSGYGQGQSAPASPRHYPQRPLPRHRYEDEHYHWRADMGGVAVDGGGPEKTPLRDLKGPQDV